VGRRHRSSDGGLRGAAGVKGLLAYNNCAKADLRPQPVSRWPIWGFTKLIE
jgi:hypothetical protein